MADAHRDKVIRDNVRRLFWLLSLLVALLLLAFPFYRPPYFAPMVSLEPKALPPMQQEVTGNTVRLASNDPFEAAAVISQTVYPATFEDNKPNAVILVREDQPHVAILSAMVIHFPIDAPILYIESDRIPEMTLKEIKRLDPDGVSQDGNTQVYLMGDVGSGVTNQLKEMRLKVRWIQGEDLPALNATIDEFRATLQADHRDITILLPEDHLDLAITAASWVAHMGGRLFFVQGDRVPAQVWEQLEKRPQDAFIYLMAPRAYWSQELLTRLIQVGHVQQIPGNDP